MQESNRNIRVASDDPHLVRRFHIDLDVGMRSRESPEARHEPTSRKSRFNGDPQAARSHPPNRIDRTMNLRKAGGELTGQPLARRRQLNLAMQASKQRAPQLLLESAYVTANSGLRDMQLLRGLGETHPAGRRLEGA